MSRSGFGEVVMLHHLFLGHPCQYYGYLNPTSMENRIWVMGLGTCRCDAGGARILFGAMLEVCG
jgi:hypothetical protein